MENPLFERLQNDLRTFHPGPDALQRFGTLLSAVEKHHPAESIADHFSASTEIRTKSPWVVRASGILGARTAIFTATALLLWHQISQQPYEISLQN